MANMYARSSGFIEGTPGLAASLIEATSEEAYAAGVQAALEEARTSLRSMLHGDQRWAPWVDNVKLSWAGDALSYDFHGTDAEVAAMTDLEYGTPDQPPTALLRRHANRLVSVGAAAGDAMSEVLFGG